METFGIIRSLGATIQIILHQEGHHDEVQAVAAFIHLIGFRTDNFSKRGNNEQEYRMYFEILNKYINDRSSLEFNLEDTNT